MHFPYVFFVLACPHVHMFAPACILGLPACVPCAFVSVYVCVCVCACVCVPGEPVVGQRISPNQGHVRGGDADDRQPLRLCLPPLLIFTTCLQKLQGPTARGTTLITRKTHTHVGRTHCTWRVQ